MAGVARVRFQRVLRLQSDVDLRNSADIMMFRRTKSATKTKTEEPSPVLHKGIGTVLLCDLSGISEPGMSTAPDELIRTLNRLFEMQDTILHRHLAMILSQGSDAIRAVWTPDHANPSHAQLAFDAACEIVSELQQDSNRFGAHGCSLRVALGTGEMVLAWIGGPASKSLQVFGQANLIAEKIHGAGIWKHDSSVLLTPLTAKILQPSNRVFEVVGQLSQADGSTLDILRLVSSS